MDPWQGCQVYPAHTAIGRKTTGTWEFSLRLRPDNLGVLFRRELDDNLPNQRAKTWVAGESHKTVGPFQTAGTWHLAGANTCVYSNPRDELGATEHHVQTSNRRFRDDEFLIPRDLAEGRSRVRVRVGLTPGNRPLFPGHSWPELGWSEIRYWAYCWVMPPLSPRVGCHLGWWPLPGAHRLPGSRCSPTAVPVHLAADCRAEAVRS